MDCSLSNGNNICTSYSSGGIKRMFLANRNGFTDFYFASGDTQLTTITSIEADLIDEATDGWFDFKVHKEVTFFNEQKVISKNRTLFNQLLDATFVEITPSKRDRLTELIGSRVLIVFQDRNNRWFCMGDSELGCKITDVQNTTGTNEESNKMRIVFQNSSTHPIRFVSSTWVDANVIPSADEGCSCELLISEVLLSSASCRLIDLADCPLS